MLAEGGGYCDAVFFAHAYRAAAEMDERALRAASELAIALAPSAERSPRDHGAGPRVSRYHARRLAVRSARSFCGSRGDGPVALPVAVAVACAGHGVGLSLPAGSSPICMGLAANLISAGVRLVPLGQR